MGCGILTGWLLKGRKMRFLGNVISVLIWLLLLLLGVEVGGDDRILQGIGSIGVQALVISVAGVAGSCLLAMLLWKIISRGKSNVDIGNSQSIEKVSLWQQMKGSLIIVTFFIAGIIVGYSGVVQISGTGFEVSFYALAALMFCVGVSVGNNLSVFSSLRNQGIVVLVLPLATIIGTLAGCLVVVPIFRGENVCDVLAIGSGFGYYSLSSIFITEYRGAELGTLALLANVIREIITLLLSPLLMRWFGPLAPISAGGATSMDTTLPVIATCSGNEYVPVSIYHGFVVDFSVPFLVTFFCTI